MCGCNFSIWGLVILLLGFFFFGPEFKVTETDKPQNEGLWT